MKQHIFMTLTLFLIVSTVHLKCFILHSDPSLRFPIPSTPSAVISCVPFIRAIPSFGPSLIGVSLLDSKT